MGHAIAALGILLCALVAWPLWTPDLPRSELEARYLESAGDMMQVEAWRLHVRDRGPRDRPAIIFIHGFGSSLQTWDGWAPALANRWRVICIDLPGSGLSPPDPTGDYTDARSVQMLGALMDQLGLPHASIVGHSIGGRIAWTLAATFPERVERLVLVAPDGFASPGFEYGKAPNVPASLGLMRYALPKSLLRLNLAPAYVDANFLTDALVDRYYDLLRSPGARQALLDRMHQTVLADPIPLLAQVRAPTLLVWGQRDAMIPVSNAADYLKAIANSRLVTIADAGHLPQEEAALKSLGEVEAFFGP